MSTETKEFVCVFRSGAYYKRIENVFKCQINSTPDIDKATRLSQREAEIVEGKYGATKVKLSHIKNERVM